MKTTNGLCSMNQTISNPRFPAEWEYPSAIFMAAPDCFTDWDYCLEEAQDQFRRLVAAFTGAGEKVVLLCKDPAEAAMLYPASGEDEIAYIAIPYNDTWTRDYMMITTESDAGLVLNDFGFNAWGLKFAADRDNLVNRRLASAGVFKGRCRNLCSFILEGGSVETDGKGVLLTTSECLLSPNRNPSFSKEEIGKYLEDALSIKKILWLDHGFLAGDDTDSHIDTLARLCPDSRIVYTSCTDTSDMHFGSLSKMERQLRELTGSEGQTFECIPLPLPDAIFDEDGERLPATYANYLVTNRNLFLPVYSQPENDSEAVRTMRRVFPGKNIITVECSTLLRQHGSLHCSTMQIPLNAINPEIWHQKEL